MTLKKLRLHMPALRTKGGGVCNLAGKKQPIFKCKLRSSNWWNLELPPVARNYCWIWSNFLGLESPRWCYSNGDGRHLTAWLAQVWSSFLLLPFFLVATKIDQQIQYQKFDVSRLGPLNVQICRNLVFWIFGEESRFSRQWDCLVTSSAYEKRECLWAPRGPPLDSTVGCPTWCQVFQISWTSHSTNAATIGESTHLCHWPKMEGDGWEIAEVLRYFLILYEYCQN